jgi:hypothetical protein
VSISTRQTPAQDQQQLVSRFEFWPAWAMYAPVVLQWFYLALRYRSLTLPFIANPRLTLAGMVGVGKSELMSQAKGYALASILPWVRIVVDSRSPEAIAADALVTAEAADIGLPFVCKPDIGCRGSGVKLIHSLSELTDAISRYPAGAALLCQRLSRFEPEVGIFYTREVQQNSLIEPSGVITGLTFKTSPSVVGDGMRTVGALISADARAKTLLHLYQPRFATRWHDVLPEGERLRLVFSASHCRGAVFTDARAHITPTLTHAVDRIMRDLPDFHYGRLDVKFRDLTALESGSELEIVEINGASAESIHIWDRRAGLLEAWRTLMWQYRTLFQFGAAQRSKGFRTPGLAKLYRHWRLEKTLTKYYPTND